MFLYHFLLAPVRVCILQVKSVLLSNLILGAYLSRVSGEGVKMRIEGFAGLLGDTSVPSFMRVLQSSEPTVGPGHYIITGCLRFPGIGERVKALAA